MALGERIIHGKPSRPLLVEDYTHYGFGGEDHPRETFPTLVGYPTYAGWQYSDDFVAQDYYVGEEALQLRGMLKLHYPIEGGVIRDWVEMEKIWTYIFSSLEEGQRKYPVLLTDSPLSSAGDREKMVEIMFESLEVPGLNISMQPVLGILASGRAKGVAVQIDSSCTHCVPVIDSLAVANATRTIQVGERDVLRALRNFLIKGRESVRIFQDWSTYQDLAEKYCYVAEDPGLENAKFERGELGDISHELANLETIHVGRERFQAPEVLFDPSLVQREEPPLAGQIAESILQTGREWHSDLWANIVLFGAGAKLPGLQERLARELGDIAPGRPEIKVKTCAEWGYSSWIGGSIIAAMAHTTKGIWVARRNNKGEYQFPRFLPQ